MRMGGLVMNRVLCGGLVLSSAMVAMLVAPVMASSSSSSSKGTVLFEETPGVMEFTGRMIARPVENAPAAAGNRLAPWLVEYVWQTNEYIFDVPAGMTENTVASSLLATGDYLYVEPDWRVWPAIRPNDTNYNSQWHHNNIDSELAWNIETGDRSVIVGICDTGVDTDHPDLQGNRVSGYNAPNRQAESSGGAIEDLNGHGTNTAGTAAAIGNNGRGVAGVGWDLSHMPIRVSNRSDGSASITDITNGARWAVENGAQVANASYSGVTSSSVQSTGSYINSIGGSLTWSAGNDGRRVDSPDHANVIIVGATTTSDSRSSFSNYGVNIDVMAPGSNIYTTRRGGSYGGVSGTSFSAPMTAGLLALIWSYSPGLTPAEAEGALFAGCDSMGNSTLYGYGRINSNQSLANSQSFRCVVTPDPLVGGSNAVLWALGGDPNTDTGMYYSLTGLGSTFVSQLGVTLDIANGQEAGPIQRSDANGDTVWQRNIPRVPKPKVVWVQAAQASGQLSNVVTTQIN